MNKQQNSQKIPWYLNYVRQARKNEKLMEQLKNQQEIKQIIDIQQTQPDQSQLIQQQEHQQEIKSNENDVKMRTSFKKSHYSFVYPYQKNDLVGNLIEQVSEVQHKGVVVIKNAQNTIENVQQELEHLKKYNKNADYFLYQNNKTKEYRQFSQLKLKDWDRLNNYKEIQDKQIKDYMEKQKMTKEKELTEFRDARIETSKQQKLQEIKQQEEKQKLKNFQLATISYLTKVAENNPEIKIDKLQGVEKENKKQYYEQISKKIYFHDNLVKYDELVDKVKYLSSHQELQNFETNKEINQKKYITQKNIQNQIQKSQIMQQKVSEYLKVHNLQTVGKNNLNYSYKDLYEKQIQEKLIMFQNRRQSRSIYQFNSVEQEEKEFEKFRLEKQKQIRKQLEILNQQQIEKNEDSDNDYMLSSQELKLITENQFIQELKNNGLDQNNLQTENDLNDKNIDKESQPSQQQLDIIVKPTKTLKRIPSSGSYYYNEVRANKTQSLRQFNNFIKIQLKNQEEFKKEFYMKKLNSEGQLNQERTMINEYKQNRIDLQKQKNARIKIDKLSSMRIMSIQPSQKAENSILKITDTTVDDDDNNNKMKKYIILKANTKLQNNTNHHNINKRRLKSYSVTDRSNRSNFSNHQISQTEQKLEKN